MDAKVATKVARDWLSEMLADEGISNLGLEEVEFDELSDQWRITLGFSRPWNTQRNALMTLTGEPAARRAYRVITINDRNGKIISMRKRDADDI